MKTAFKIAIIFLFVWLNTDCLAQKRTAYNNESSRNGIVGLSFDLVYKVRYNKSDKRIEIGAGYSPIQVNPSFGYRYKGVVYKNEVAGLMDVLNDIKVKSPTLVINVYRGSYLVKTVTRLTVNTEGDFFGIASPDLPIYIENIQSESNDLNSYSLRIESLKSVQYNGSYGGWTFESLIEAYTKSKDNIASFNQSKTNGINAFNQQNYDEAIKELNKAISTYNNLNEKYKSGVNIDEVKRYLENAKSGKAKEEEAQKKAETEAKAKQEAAAAKKAEEETKLKEAEAQKKTEAEASAKKAEEQKTKEEEAQKLKEEQARQKAEAEQRKQEEAEAKRKAEEEAKRQRQTEYNQWKAQKQKEQSQYNAAAMASTVGFMYLLGGFIYDGMGEIKNPDYVYKPYLKQKAQFFIGLDIGFSLSASPIIFASEYTTMTNGSYVTTRELQPQTAFTLNLESTFKMGVDSDNYTAYGYLNPKVGISPFFNGSNLSPFNYGGHVAGGAKWIKAFADFGQGTRIFSWTSLDTEEYGTGKLKNNYKKWTYGLKFTISPDEDFIRNHLLIGIISEEIKTGDDYLYSENYQLYNPNIPMLQRNSEKIEGYTFHWKKDHTFDLYINYYPKYWYGGLIPKNSGSFNSEFGKDKAGTFIEIGFIRSFDWFHSY